MIVLGVAIAVLLQDPSQTTRLSWVPNPRVASGSWVADPANHLTPATRASIDSIVSALERETSSEIGVAIIDSMDGLEPFDAALLLHRRWGVGKAARDNGLLLLWSPKLRKTAISVGDGLEGVLTDAHTGRIQDEFILPAFRRNDFDAGILAGVTALAAAARKETDWRDLRGVAVTRSRAEKDRRFLKFLSVPVGFAGLMLSALGGAWAIRRYRRNRPRNCPSGHGRMRRLGEREDDAMLASGELAEERVSSVDYDVWKCDECAKTIVLPYRRWTSKYSECPKCKRRTLLTSTSTMKAATYSSTGMRQVHRRCKHCDYDVKNTETIPMLERVSSSSGGSSFGGGGGGGGGGSSFGGGSSSGGGSSRSY